MAQEVPLSLRSKSEIRRMSKSERELRQADAVNRAKGTYKQTSIAFHDDMRAQIEAYAAKKGLTFTGAVQQLVISGLRNK